MKQNDNQQLEQLQQRELIYNISSEHQLFLQQIQEQQKEQEDRYANFTQVLTTIFLNQKQGKVKHTHFCYRNSTDIKLI